MSSGGAESFLVFAAMRNEGPFIVEWVAWYRMLGFRILIAHNDCTDHSPDLLNVLARAGWIEVIEHHPDGVLPKTSAHRAARAHPAVAAADWMMVCDVDEFLVPHVGDGTIAGYLDHLGRDHQGVCFHWRCFGSGGHTSYEDGLVHRQFLQCGREDSHVNTNFKTLFREPARFARLSDHAPAGFNGKWGQGNAFFVDSEGRRIARFDETKGPVRFTAVEGITHRRAQMNHYVLRSPESYALKRGTPSASAGVDRYTDRYYRQRDKNGLRDLSALAHAAAFDPIHAQAMALPEVRWLHHLCCADYIARLCAHQGRDPAGDPRWRRHMAEAARD